MTLNISPWRSLKTRITLFSLIIFVIGIWSLAFYASRTLHEGMERLSSEQQFSTVSFIAAQLDDQFKERLDALALIASAIDTPLIDQPLALQKYIEQRPILQILFNAGAFATGLDGTTLASLPVSENRIGVNYMDRDYLIAVLKTGKAAIGRPVIGKTLRAPVFAMAVPIRDRQGQVIGVLAGVTDLSKASFLDSITGNRYGKTGGYLLIAPQHRLVVTATDKRRIMDPLPTPGVNPSVDRFIEGYEGSETFTNPRGEEVLASAKGVPVAGWYVGVQLPIKEAFAPIDEMQQRLLLAAVFLTLLAGSLTWWMLQRELAPMLAAAETLATQAEDSQHQPLPLPISHRDEIGQLIAGFNHLLETLAQRENLLKQILDTSSVAIFVVNGDGRITQANQRMAEMFACPLDALIGNEYVALVHPAEREVGRQKMLALLASTIPAVDLDRLYWRADQTEFWGHLTGRRFRDDSGEERGLIGVIADVTVRKQAEEALKESEKRFRDLFEKNSSVMFLTDPFLGKITDANESAATYFGYPRERLIGMPVSEINPQPPASLSEARQQVLNEEANHFLFPYRLASGEVRDVEVYATPIKNGDHPLLLCIVHDITERKQAEEKLHLAASVFSHSREGIMITAADGTIIDVNAAFTRITGYRRDEVLGQNPRLLNSGRQEKAYYTALWRDLIENGHWYGEVWNRRKNGEVYAEMQTISVVRDAQGEPQHYVSLFSDITPLKEHQNQLEHIAHYDALTSLPNRVLLADRLQQAMAQAQRRGQRLAVAYLDLDGFKAINDNHGHGAGDQLLIALAARMKQALREGDTLARLGGDEFVAVLLDLADVTASVPMLSRLLAAAAQPVPAGDLVLQVSASLGVTFYPQVDEIDADQLLRQADQAMYQAKLAGKNRYHFFDAEQDSNARSHHESLEHIRRALSEHEFVLHYQPKVNMRTGSVIGAEALIRWQHPERGLLPPAVFLPVIEDHPLAVEVGEWVIDSALSQIEHWQASGLNIPISVNIGARQLQQTDFVERLQAILAAHPKVKASDLELEVLETSALEDLAQISGVIEQCREIGVMFALDDFGTGYSSLTYLKRLAVSLLKIDQSFVRDMLDDPDDLAILQGVIGLAAAFRRQVIAEGVESVEHGEMLLQLGCEQAQGYGIARPMPAVDIPGWVAAWQPDPAWGNAALMTRDDLPRLFAGVEYRAYIGAIEDFLKNERDAPQLLDHHKCRFGLWLDAEGQARYGAQPAFAIIDDLHQQVHVLSAKLCALKIAGRDAAGLAGLDALHALRDGLLEQLKTLVQTKG